MSMLAVLAARAGQFQIMGLHERVGLSVCHLVKIVNQTRFIRLWTQRHLSAPWEYIGLLGLSARVAPCTCFALAHLRRHL